METIIHPAMIAVGLDRLGIGGEVIQAEAWSDPPEAVHIIVVMTALVTMVVSALVKNKRRRYEMNKISEIKDESNHGDRKGKRQPVYEMLRNMRLNPRTQSDMVARSVGNEPRERDGKDDVKMPITVEGAEGRLS